MYFCIMTDMLFLSVWCESTSLHVRLYGAGRLKCTMLRCWPRGELCINIHKYLQKSVDIRLTCTMLCCWPSDGTFINRTSINICEYQADIQDAALLAKRQKLARAMAAGPIKLILENKLNEKCGDYDIVVITSSTP